MKPLHQARRENRPKPETEFVVSDRIALLDFLFLKLSDKPRKYVKSILSHKAVSVDGKTITQFNHELTKGQTVRIAHEKSKECEKKDLPAIIYEDADLIVINKPSGLLSIATEKEKVLTAYHQLTDYVRLKDPNERIFAVHRLDRDTSGVLIVAKNEKIKLALQNNWSDLVSERGYYAIVEGSLDEKSGRIESWLKETKTKFMYSSARPGDGLKAVTYYQVIYENEDYSLLDIKLETGRKNQIRVHMKDIGHLVAGDKKYGAKTDPLKRLCLHAYKLSLKHPFTHQIMHFETAMPPRFKALFSSQNKKSSDS